MQAFILLREQVLEHPALSSKVTNHPGVSRIEVKVNQPGLRNFRVREFQI